MLKFKPQQTRKYYITASFILSLGFSLFFLSSVWEFDYDFHNPDGSVEIWQAANIGVFLLAFTLIPFFFLLLVGWFLSILTRLGKGQGNG